MKILNFAFLGLVTAATAQTSDDHAYLGIFAETHVMRIMGMKRALPNLPAGIKLPPAAAAFMPGAPTRSLNVRLWSPGLAPDSATATLAPPSGLGLGDKLNLDLYRPQPATAGGNAGGGGGGGGNSQPPDLTIKIYWGSSPTVQPGQPKTFNMATLTPSQQMEMASHMRMPTPGGGGGSYFYKDGWTTAHWPTESDAGTIPDSASLAGTFTLNTSYAGNVSIDTAPGVDFLPAINITSPDLGSKIDFSGPIAFQWDPLPNAIGQFATIFGMEGKNTLILWSSSEVYVEQLMADMGYMQMSDVKSEVDGKVFMAGGATSMTVPAGIFQNADFSMMNMVAYGPGTAKDGTQPTPRIQTKSTLMLMLGGKKGPRGGG